MKKISMPHAIFILLLPLFSSCQTTPNTNGTITFEQRKNLEQYMPLLASQPLYKRTNRIPNSLLHTWKVADGELNPIAESYQAYLPTASEKDQLKQSFNALPEEFQRILKQKLTRIFFVKNLIGAGITDWVINRKTGEQFYTIMLNPRLFHTSTKEWLEYRANSMFTTGEYHITYTNIPNVSALTYTLLHEGAHIIDFEQRITPVVDPLIAQYKTINSNSTPFTQNVWYSYQKPRPTYDFQYRDKLNPYHLNITKGYISNAELPEIFNTLSLRPFVTLYASRSWAEDFADLSALYYLQKMVTSPLRLQLKKGKETITDITPLDSSLNQQRLSKLGLLMK